MGIHPLALVYARQEGKRLRCGEEERILPRRCSTCSKGYKEADFSAELTQLCYHRFDQEQNVAEKQQRIMLGQLIRIVSQNSKAAASCKPWAS